MQKLEYQKLNLYIILLSKFGFTTIKDLQKYIKPIHPTSFTRNRFSCNSNGTLLVSSLKDNNIRSTVYNNLSFSHPHYLARPWSFILFHLWIFFGVILRGLREQNKSLRAAGIYNNILQARSRSAESATARGQRIPDKDGAR